MSEEWSSVKEGCSASEQAEQFEKLIKEKLNTFCPEKQMNLGSQDKLFISAELKRIARLKNREYVKKGKCEKYLTLKKDFDVKYKKEAKKYLEKNLDAFEDAKPGQAFNVLKRLGAQPGDCADGGTFSLPEHENENLSVKQSAERMAEHFASISGDFPPLDISLLPSRVQDKLDSLEKATNCVRV